MRRNKAQMVACLWSQPAPRALPHPVLSCTPRLSHTSATASGAHVCHVCPLVGGGVVLLHGAQALPGSPIVTPDGIQLPWNRPTTEAGV